MKRLWVVTLLSQTALLLLLILIPYLAYREIDEALGDRSLFRLLSERRPAETPERT